MDITLWQEYHVQFKVWQESADVVLFALLMISVTAHAASQWDGYPYTNNDEFEYGLEYGNTKITGAVPYFEFKYDIYAKETGKTLEKDTIRFELKNIPSLDESKEVLYQKVSNYEVLYSTYESEGVFCIENRSNYKGNIIVRCNSGKYSDINSQDSYIAKMQPMYEAEGATDISFTKTVVDGYPAVKCVRYYQGAGLRGNLFILVDDLYLPCDTSMETYISTQEYQPTYAFFDIKYEVSMFMDVFGETTLKATTLDEAFAMVNDSLYRVLDAWTAKAESELDISWNRTTQILIPDYKYDKKAAIPAKTDVQASNHASETAGEAGYSVPAMIVVSLLGAGAALAASAAAVGGMDAKEAGIQVKKREKSKESKGQSAYKMFIYKEFGDSIRYDRQGVQVNARMVEITPDGREIERTDLTQQISISSDGRIDVEDCRFLNGSMCALISCTSKPGSSKPEEGVVTFRFSGEGGTFTNHVTFRLIGEPYFILQDSTDMILGDGRCYDIKAELFDFMYPVDKVNFVLFNSPATAAAEKLDETHFVIHLQNNSAMKSETFYKTEEYKFEVTFENDKETAHEVIGGRLLPEGLSVYQKSATIIEDNRFAIKCYSSQNDETNKDIYVTGITFILAVSGVKEDGTAYVSCPVLSEKMFRFDQMTADTDKIANIANNANCTFSSHKLSMDDHMIIDFDIQPKQQIPQESGINYDAVLPVTCNCNNQTYCLNIPVRMLGDQLLAEMQSKKKEVELLKKRLVRYLDRDEIAGFLASYDQKVQNMSSYDIRLMSMCLVYRSELKAYEAKWQGLKGDMLDWGLWGAEWVKWAGDQAFSLLNNYYAGPQNGPILDSILSPARDIICEELGTCLDQWYSGKDVSGINNKVEKYSQTVLVMIENCLSNAIDGKTDVKKAGQLLALYCVLL